MKAELCDTVKIQYELELEDGTIFESIYDYEPVEFTVGHNEIIANVDRAIINMNQCESKTISLPFEKGFGPHSLLYKMGSIDHENEKCKFKRQNIYS